MAGVVEQIMNERQGGKKKLAEITMFLKSILKQISYYWLPLRMCIILYIIESTFWYAQMGAHEESPGVSSIYRYNSLSKNISVIAGF